MTHRALRLTIKLPSCMLRLDMLTSASRGGFTLARWQMGFIVVLALAKVSAVLVWA